MKIPSKNPFRNIIAYALFFLFGIIAAQLNIIDYLSDSYHYHYLFLLFKQHLMLVASSMSLAIILGLSAGIIATRKRFKKISRLLMYLIGLGQTVPSLAILAFSMLLFGVGTLPGVIALLVISILPIAKSTYSGLSSIPPYLLDAAKGIGLPPMFTLYHIELPNAAKLIFSGVRIALVLNIGSASLCYIIGAGGLGDLIFSGIQMMNIKLLIIGAISVIFFALIADYIMSALEKTFTPKGLK